MLDGVIIAYIGSNKTHKNTKMMYNRLKDIGGRVCHPNPDTGFSFVAGRAFCRPLNLVGMDVAEDKRHGQDVKR